MYNTQYLNWMHILWQPYICVYIHVIVYTMCIYGNLKIIKIVFLYKMRANCADCGFSCHCQFSILFSTRPVCHVQATHYTSMSLVTFGNWRFCILANSMANNGERSGRRQEISQCVTFSRKIKIERCCDTGLWTHNSKSIPVPRGDNKWLHKDF